MNAPERHLCEICHERDATHHVCNGGTRESSHFCERCFESSVPPEVVRTTMEARAAHCQYCGAQPCAGGTDPLAIAAGIHRTKYMCMPCSIEHNEYFLRHCAVDESKRSPQEQQAALRDLLEQADRHMEQWVATRDSR